MSQEDARVLDWLLEDDQPAVRYRALLDLVGRSRTDGDVKEARMEIPRRGWAKKILDLELPDGHWEPNEQSLYLPKYTATNWRMIVLSDLGLTQEDPALKPGLDLYVREWLAGGKALQGENEVCVLGNFARALTRFGLGDDGRVKEIFDWLIEDQLEDGGWHCDHPASRGTLDCWEALAAYLALPREQWSRRMKRSAEAGAEFYLERRLFRQGRRYEPWFRFHYPVHYYYDVLVGLDMVTGLGHAGDKRLLPALRVLTEKRRPDGSWNLDAVHRDLGPGAGYRPKTKSIKFALEEPGAPSKWVTLTAMRVLKRVREAG